MIPKILHQIWIDPSGQFGQLPGDVLSNTKTWVSAEPQYAYRLWRLPNLFRLCQMHNLPDAGRAMQVCRFPSMQADIGRLVLLHIHGGFWADLKLQLLVPFLDSLVEYDLVLTQHFPKDDLPDPGTHISSSFIGAVPGNPLISHALPSVVNNVNRRMDHSIYHVTGATNLMLALDQIPAQALGRYRRLGHAEAWNNLFQIGSGSYNGLDMHWSIREGRESRYLE